MHIQGHARLPAKQLAYLTPTNPHSHGGEEQVLLGIEEYQRALCQPKFWINSYYFGKMRKMIVNYKKQQNNLL